jgi:hypothetical protein
VSLSSFTTGEPGNRPGSTRGGKEETLLRSFCWSTASRVHLSASHLKSRDLPDCGAVSERYVLRYAFRERWEGAGFQVSLSSFT